jgi:hemerythrin-like metal-binding protein
MKHDMQVGVPEIDAEHQVQLELLAALQAALEASDLARSEESFSVLESYTTTHFLAEQLLMRLNAYPGYEAHVQEHDRLLDELRRLRRAIRSEAEPRALAGRVERWLRTHIQTADQAFANFVKEHPRQPGQLARSIPAGD